MRLDATVLIRPQKILSGSTMFMPASCVGNGRGRRLTFASTIPCTASVTGAHAPDAAIWLPVYLEPEPDEVPEPELPPDAPEEPDEPDDPIAPDPPEELELPGEPLAPEL